MRTCDHKRCCRRSAELHRLGSAGSSLHGGTELSRSCACYVSLQCTGETALWKAEEPGFRPLEVGVRHYYLSILQRSGVIRRVWVSANEFFISFCLDLVLFGVFCFVLFILGFFVWWPQP